ncbi:nuclear transport factor 2 family protein [Plantactinospora sp. WMMC1484]|uniref:nuclear transport factor 2 family protein n=1 Tax=Plantactinospora sp. WMMC1484 TaxID=3404122 RepID=UPI003BF514DB
MPTRAAQFYRDSIDLLTQRRMHEFVDLFAEDAVVEYAFPPKGWPAFLHGREAVRGALGNFPDFLRIEYAKNVTIHETTDPEVIIGEFILGGTVTATGQPYESRYIEVVRVRDDQFVEFRDYWNPMLALELMPNGHFDN